MGRIINTDDIHNRMQVYPELGVFRDEILAIVSRVVMDCPTAKDDMVVCEIVDRVLEIIEDYKAIEPTKLSASTHNILLDRMKHKVISLKRGEQE